MSESKHTPGFRLRWRKNPRERGLSAIGAGPPGSSLYDANGTRFATASAFRSGSTTKGWYWVAGWESGIPHKNTYASLVATEDDAKRDAIAYVRACLAKAEGRP